MAASAALNGSPSRVARRMTLSLSCATGFYDAILRIRSHGIPEHRCPAPDASAMARVLLPRSFIDLFIDNQPVFDKQFFARCNVRGGLDENPFAIFHRLAVCVARVIKPTRAVAASTAVDYPPVGQTEQECVPVDTVPLVTAHRLTPGHAFALVFEHALARRERPQCEYPFPMNRRSPDSDASHPVLPRTIAGAEYKAAKSFPPLLFSDGGIVCHEARDPMATVS